MGDNAAYYGQGEVVVQGEEEIDENYDPTDFLHNLGHPQEAAHGAGQQSPEVGETEMPTYDVGNHEGKRVPVELHHAEDGSMIINPVPAPVSVDVINDDLDISDSDEESDQPSSGGHHQPSAPEPPPPDEDGIWF